MALTQTRTEQITPQDIHDILRNDRRRNVIEQLRGTTGSVSLRELSERIAEREASEAPAPRNLRQSVYNSLHQTHLPKLDDREVVRYDRDRKQVELREGARQVDVYMGIRTGFGVTWATYYRTFSVVSLFLIVAANADVPLVSAVPTLVWATVFLALAGLSAVYQLWPRRWFYLRSILS
ncbi:hypothetical protein ACKVMT_17580 [Halobacteriales archaeon Cl-PHB]